MNRDQYHQYRREAYWLRERLKGMRMHSAMADSRLAVQIDSDNGHMAGVQQALNRIDTLIRPKGRDLMRLSYLKRKLETVYFLRARAGRERNHTAFGVYHRMLPAIQAEIRRS